MIEDYISIFMCSSFKCVFVCAFLSDDHFGSARDLLVVTTVQYLLLSFTISIESEWRSVSGFNVSVFFLDSCYFVINALMF